MLIKTDIDGPNNYNAYLMNLIPFPSPKWYKKHFFVEKLS